MKPTNRGGDPAAQTEGIVIRFARFYDLLLKVLSLGQEGRFRRGIITTAGIAEGHRVLDVGCGTGTLALAAENVVGAQGRVQGIDPAPEMIARARAKAKRKGARAEFQVGVVEALDFPDESFDVVISTLVFHHLPDSLKPEALAEIRRVLAPGGRMVVVDAGKPDKLLPMADATGFGTITTGRVKPAFLFSLIAERGPHEGP